MTDSARVVVVGGGFAGLETAFLLKHRLHDRVDVTLVSDQPEFLFRPNTIYLPFGAELSSLKIPLRSATARGDLRFVEARVEGIDAAAHRLSLTGKDPLDYDVAVLATGATTRPQEIPGMAENAVTIWTPDGMLALKRRFEALIDEAEKGKMQRVLFVVPPNNRCSGPLYEMVFMLDTHVRRANVRNNVHIEWATYEAGYIQAFGPRLDEVVVDEFDERGIVGHKDKVVTEIRPGEAVFADKTTIAFDLCVSFPPYAAAMRWDGLPADDRGFVRCEFGTRQVWGVDDVYAPGDGGDFPVKQAFLAFLQADATAETIAAEVRGGAPGAVFDPVSMCVMEQLDKATFAQVPLKLTGEPSRPVEVDMSRADLYKVGVSPLWRLGKKLLGLYLPMRFRAGEPFHAGTAWQMMDVGLHGMSAVLAH